jgi:hypothetical protein
MYNVEGHDPEEQGLKPAAVSLRAARSHMLRAMIQKNKD